jgi:hypothetical protein
MSIISSMKYLFLSLLAVSFLACHSGTKDTGQQNYQQNKNYIAEKEMNEPLTFLQIEGADHKNLLGKTVIKTIVTNSATICSYKDVRIKILSYNKDGQMMEEHEDVVPDIVTPGSSVAYKTKYFLPKTVDSIALSIMSATPLVDSTRK